MKCWFEMLIWNVDLKCWFEMLIWNIELKYWLKCVFEMWIWNVELKYWFECGFEMFLKLCLFNRIYWSFWSCLNYTFNKVGMIDNVGYGFQSFIAWGIRQFITDSRLKSQGRRRDELMCFSFNATLGVDLFVWFLLH